MLPTPHIHPCSIYRRRMSYTIGYFTHLYIQRQPIQTRCLPKESPLEMICISELFRQASLVGCDVPNSSRTVGFQSIGVRVAPSDCRARKPNPELAMWNCGTLEPWNFGTLELWKLGTLERWNLATLEPSNAGTLERWGSEPSETLEPLERSNFLKRWDAKPYNTGMQPVTLEA